MAKHVFGGDWTSDKLERVREYLCAYIKIFKQNPRATYFTTIYVDAFAGTGGRVEPADRRAKARPVSTLEDDADTNAQSFQKGSARIALEVAPPFDRFLLFDTMTACPQHTFQVLTKRSRRLREIADELPWPKNVWIGVSVEDQWVLGRIDDLRQVPASVRFLSCEPLLGPMDNLHLEGIDWVIVGGESGPGARPMKPEWVESILKQCRQAKVAFFFKQWGGTRKDITGRELNGRTYDELPMTLPLGPNWPGGWTGIGPTRRPCRRIRGPW